MAGVFTAALVISAGGEGLSPISKYVAKIDGLYNDSLSSLSEKFGFIHLPQSSLPRFGEMAFIDFVHLEGAQKSDA